MTLLSLLAAAPHDPETTSGWPPVLVVGVLVLFLAAGGAGAVLLWRAWLGLRPQRRRDR